MADDLGVTLVCAGCGRPREPRGPAPWRCPGADESPGTAHLVVERVACAGGRLPAPGPAHPLARGREWTLAGRLARAAGLGDEALLESLASLDGRIARTWGGGLTAARAAESPTLAAALGLARGRVLVLDETAQAGGSHKTRHLAGFAWLLLLRERLGLADAAERTAPLAVASCGNAAVAAALVARALDRELVAFVPAGADPAALARIEELGARIERCAAGAGAPPGDPCIARLRAAVRAGALPFSCQASENGLVLAGAATLGHELALAAGERGGAARLDRVAVPVGGGALLSAIARGLEEARAAGLVAGTPRLVAVETEAVDPLARAVEALRAELARSDAEGTTVETPVGPAAEAPALERAVRRLAADAARRLPPLAAPAGSIASGILDPECYDWPLAAPAVIASGGEVVTVGESRLLEATALAREATGAPVSPTGVAGLAGLIELAARGALAPDEHVGLVLTGREW